MMATLKLQAINVKSFVDAQEREQNKRDTTFVPLLFPCGDPYAEKFTPAQGRSDPAEGDHRHNI